MELGKISAVHLGGITRGGKLHKTISSALTVSFRTRAVDWELDAESEESAAAWGAAIQAEVEAAKAVATVATVATVDRVVQSA